MTTSTTTQPINHRNTASAGRGGRIAVLVAGSALAVALVGLAVLPKGGSVSGDAATSIEAPRSALLDGPAFDTAISASIANIEAPHSALLDGPALQTAIDAAVANIEAPRSALLDGPVFQAAIDASIAVAAE